MRTKEEEDLDFRRAIAYAGQWWEYLTSMYPEMVQETVKNFGLPPETTREDILKRLREMAG